MLAPDTPSCVRGRPNRLAILLESGRDTMVDSARKTTGKDNQIKLKTFDRKATRKASSLKFR